MTCTRVYIELSEKGVLRGFRHGLAMPSRCLPEVTSDLRPLVLLVCADEDLLPRVGSRRPPRIGGRSPVLPGSVLVRGRFLLPVYVSSSHRLSPFVQILELGRLPVQVALDLQAHRPSHGCELLEGEIAPLAIVALDITEELILAIELYSVPCPVTVRREELDDQDLLEVAPRGRRPELLESRSVRIRAGGMIDILLYDLPSLPLGELPQLDPLNLGILILISRGDSGVEGDFHDSPPPSHSVEAQTLIYPESNSMFMKVTFDSKGKIVTWDLPMTAQNEKKIMDWAELHKLDVALLNLWMQFILYCTRK